MARPKSVDKRGAILSAAVRVFAEHSLAAPTSAISGAAGIAEGSLFTYFITKDDLINALYRDIKLRMAEALMSGFERKKDFRSRLQHIWDSYVNWGVKHALEMKVLAQLQVSGKLTEESKALGAAPFIEIEVMARDALARGLVRDLPMEFIGATLQALAGTTMDFMTSDPRQAARFRKSGFEIFWHGIASESRVSTQASNRP